MHRCHAIDHRVLDAQGRELAAAQRRLRCGEIDAQQLIRAEPLLPRDRACRGIDIVFIGVVATQDAPKDAAREARMKVGRISNPQSASERNAAGFYRATGRSVSREFLREELLESARADREERFCAAHRASARCRKSSRSWPQNGSSR